MSVLNFTQAGNVYESEPVQFSKDTVLELNFENIPKQTGVTISIQQSLTKKGWQTCYTDTLRYGKTWCKTLQCVSENAWYKVVTTTNPDNSQADYE